MCERPVFRYGLPFPSWSRRGGIALNNPDGFSRYIHSIENTPVRSKFELDIQKIKGNRGIGVISDYKDQTVLIRSHLGQYALVTVCAAKNSDDLMKNLFDKKMIDFSEMRRGEINPTELTAALISQESTLKKEYIKLTLITLKYQRQGDLVEAIGFPKEKKCTYCWGGFDLK